MADLVCGAVTGSDVLDAINLNTNNKVDKDGTKVLSDENFTFTDKAQIDTNKTGITALNDNFTNVLNGDVPFVKGSMTPMADISGLTEGQFAYDGVSKTMVIKSDVAGQTLNVGQETLLRVKNPSSGTYLNGQVVKQIGVDNGVPTIALAQADIFANAKSVGMLTQDIAPGAEGYTTTFGYVKDALTNQGGETWNIGDDLYISPSIPGGLTNVLPPVASIIGRLMSNTGLIGNLLVAPRNLIALPPVGGWMKAITTTINPGATYITFINFTDTSASAGIIADGASGTYTKTIQGTYQVSLSVSLSSITPQTNGSIITIQLWNQTTSTSLFEYNIIVGRNDTVASGSLITQDDFDTNDVLVARYKETSGNVGTAVTVEHISFLVNSIVIR